MLSIITSWHFSAKSRFKIIGPRITSYNVCYTKLLRGINPKDPANAQQLAHITKEATINGIDYAFVIATGITAVAFILSFFIRKVRIDRGEKGAEEIAVKPARA